MNTKNTQKIWRKAPDPGIDMKRIPQHIAVIMDGNGRWAEQRGKKHTEGHEAGARGVRQCIEGCRELGVTMLSIYAFSTENWNRSEFEVNALFKLMSHFIHKEIEDIHHQNICVRIMGDLNGLPERAKKDMLYCIDKTRDNSAMTINVGLNYGSRAEILNAARSFAEDVKSEKYTPEQLDEKLFSDYLYIPESAEVDLLIRTSGEYRLSNFMLWQLSYAEIIVTPVLWPDFSRKDLFDAVKEYQSRDRRFGGRNNAE